MYFQHCTKKPRALQEISWESDSFFLGRPLEIIVYFSFSSRNTRLIKKILVFVLNHVIEKKILVLVSKDLKEYFVVAESQPTPTKLMTMIRITKKCHNLYFIELKYFCLDPRGWTLWLFMKKASFPQILEQKMLGESVWLFLPNCFPASLICFNISFAS